MCLCRYLCYCDVLVLEWTEPSQTQTPLGTPSWSLLYSLCPPFRSLGLDPLIASPEGATPPLFVLVFAGDGQDRRCLFSAAGRAAEWSPSQGPEPSFETRHSGFCLNPWASSATSWMWSNIPGAALSHSSWPYGHWVLDWASTLAPSPWYPFPGDVPAWWSGLTMYGCPWSPHLSHDLAPFPHGSWGPLVLALLSSLYQSGGSLASS